ncbi:MAG: lysoplasmalogenase [Deltaproteobacteria bacterium]|nr:lysoplasmalogenase [Deltaproteobacteria bacterium]
MSRSQLILTWSAAVSAAGLLFSETFGLRVLIYVFKPLTMVFIVAVALIGMKGDRKFYGTFVLLGLLFSLLGDILLMLPSNLFVQGLVSFLIAHLFYILAFSKGRNLRLKTLSWLPFLLLGVLIYGFMLPSLGEMTIPVLFYMIVILTMGWRAYTRWG